MTVFKFDLIVTLYRLGYLTYLPFALYVRKVERFLMIKEGLCFSISALIKVFGNLTVKNCLYIPNFRCRKKKFKTSSATLEDVTTALQNYLRYADKCLKRTKSCENQTEFFVFLCDSMVAIVGLCDMRLIVLSVFFFFEFCLCFYASVNKCND